MSQAQRRSNPNLAPEEWPQTSGEWPGPNSGSVGWMDSGMQPHVSGGAAKKRSSRRAANPVPPEDDLLFDSRLAKRSRIRMHGKSGLLPRLALLLLLLSVFDVTAVAVARPDLCPISACVSLGTKLHQAVPFLPGTPPAPAAINAAPSKMEIAATPGTTSTAQLTLANVANASLEWHAAADSTWLTIAPATGTLGVGASVSLTISAKATDLGLGQHGATITVTTTHGNVTIPVTVTVTASAATPTPTALQIGPSRSA
jgi:hypothetical protein